MGKYDSYNDSDYYSYDFFGIKGRRWPYKSGKTSFDIDAQIYGSIWPDKYISSGENIHDLKKGGLFTSTISWKYPLVTKAAPGQGTLGTYHQVARITSVAQTCWPWTASNQTIVISNRTGKSIQGDAHWKTSAIRSTKIPKPEGSRWSVLPQHLRKMWEENPQGRPQPTWDPTFSPTASSMGGVGPSPTVGAGAALVALELTKNVTATPCVVTCTSHMMIE